MKVGYEYGGEDGGMEDGKMVMMVGGRFATMV